MFPTLCCHFDCRHLFFLSFPPLHYSPTLLPPPPLLQVLIMETSVT